MLSKENINNITNFILTCKSIEASCFEIYNSFVNMNKITIIDEDDVMWILEYINDLQMIKKHPDAMRMLCRDYNQTTHDN